MAATDFPTPAAPRHFGKSLSFSPRIYLAATWIPALLAVYSSLLNFIILVFKLPQIWPVGGPLIWLQSPVTSCPPLEALPDFAVRLISRLCCSSPGISHQEVLFLSVGRESVPNTHGAGDQTMFYKRPMRPCVHLICLLWTAA